MIKNLKKIFSNQKRILAYTVLVLISWLVWWNFTDVAIMIWNYGKFHTYTDVALSIIMITLFPLFIMGFWHKSMNFGKKSLNVGSWTGILGGIVGTLISGASCCWATLAAYVGLLPLMNLLPYDGLEVKILGTLGLLYALYDILNNIEVCQVKKR